MNIIRKYSYKERNCILIPPNIRPLHLYNNDNFSKVSLQDAKNKSSVHRNRLIRVK